MCAATVALRATSIHCECRRASMGFQIYRPRVLCQVSFGPVGGPTRVVHIAISYLPWSPQPLDFRGMWKVQGMFLTRWRCRLANGSSNSSKSSNSRSSGNSSSSSSGSSSSGSGSGSGSSSGSSSRRRSGNSSSSSSSSSSSGSGSSSSGSSSRRSNSSSSRSSSSSVAIKHVTCLTGSVSGISFGSVFPRFGSCSVRLNRGRLFDSRFGSKAFL